MIGLELFKKEWVAAIVLISFAQPALAVTRTPRVPAVPRRPAVKRPPVRRPKPAPVPAPDPVPAPPTANPGDEGPLGFHSNADGSPLFALIAAARSTLDIEIYTMEDANVRSAIRAAISRGVRVRIIKDGTPLGASCDVFGASPGKSSSDCDDQRQLVTDVNSAGGTYIPFNKSALCASAGGKCFQHGKVAVIDGARALISTGNFDATNLCDASLNPSRCDRDYSYVTEDADIVKTITAIFEKDLAGQRYDVGSLLSPATEAKMTVSPLSLQPLVDFIGSARTTLQIQNQYLKEPQINQAIIAAAQRGVRVEIMVASLCAFSKPTAADTASEGKVFTPFEQAGINVRLFTKQMKINGVAGYLHAKAIVVDGTRAWLGSVNGSTMSVSNNREYGIFFDRPEEVSALSAIMSADQANAESETWQESLQCAKD